MDKRQGQRRIRQQLKAMEVSLRGPESHPLDLVGRRLMKSSLAITAVYMLGLTAFLSYNTTGLLAGFPGPRAAPGPARVAMPVKRRGDQDTQCLSHGCNETVSRAPNADPKLNFGPKGRNVSDELYIVAPNIFDNIPVNFSSEFRNPCWRVPPPAGAGAAGAGEPVGAGPLRCLPAFLLAGFPKAGTTDIYDKLLRHPQIVRTKGKEPHWWSHWGKTIWNTVQSLNWYLDHMSTKIAPMLQRGHGLDSIVGDASATTFWEILRWRHFFPEARVGPPHVTADIIGAVLPDVKIIVTVRNPVTRAYSQFKFFNHPDFELGPVIFHNSTVAFMKMFRNCQRKWGDTRTCVYERYPDMSQRIAIGAYSVYLRDWLKVFPRDQIKIVRLEDWARDCEGALSELHDFLRLTPMDAANLTSMCQRRPSNVNIRPSKPMLPKTKAILQAFYKPFNEDLARILNDDKYLWTDNP